ncbi:zinc-binding metallopeptidase family protein [Effusibacillus dendaii]|uniref:Aminopeptidase n=1 Tax=Effusibacillus dendaii TaxID=2743772 RepID=A0A7I8D5M7_9BACL|nr:peptidase M42 [Effusibacillus dendaii]BCJ85395.1 aminopeptidase [Effusibacillus dendaii]
MKELLSKLASASGPSGSERHIREILEELLKPHVDQLTTDVLGNLIGFKKGTATDRRTVLLEANMDESGVMAIHIEDNGFIRIVPIGNLTAASLIGERVRFTTRTWGVVGVSADKPLKDVTFADLFVDVGCESRQETEANVKIGTAAVIDKGAFELGKHRIAGKSLDNRAGCAILVDVLKKLGSYEYDLYVVFAAQEEVGSRGIRAAAFSIEADLAFVVGTAKATDTPQADRGSLALGKGPAIKVMDRGVVIPPHLKQHLIKTAERMGIPYQLEVSSETISDAGQILLTRDGIPTGAVSVPMRYRQTPSQVVDLRDLEQTSKLVMESLRGASNCFL